MTVLDPRELRNAFGSFMTGVTVVTTRDANDQLVGFTANSFSSVSLDPPMLLVCPGKFLSSYDAFETSKHFAVSVLAEGQEAVSNTFAGFKGDRFAQVAHTLDQNGLATIDGAVAHFCCETRQVLTAGDHCVLIGEVYDFSHACGAGLGYAGGQYFSLGLERAALENTSGSALCGAIIERGGAVLMERTPKGFRPPQVKRDDRGQLREELMEYLAHRGIKLQLGPVYSVFDDATSKVHSVYYLGSATSDDGNAGLVTVPISDLPSLSYVSAPVADMMTRYSLEAQAQDFSLYIGDALRGDIHSISERS